MTSIVVATRNGILRAPDGTQFRLERGKTLADAGHPAVVASPESFAPMRVELVVDPDAPRELAPVPPGTSERINQLENDLAEVEDLAEHRGAELHRLAEGLVARGLTLPADDERSPGWLVDLVLEALNFLPAALDRPVQVDIAEPVAGAVAETPKAIRPPRTPRAGKATP